MNERKREHKERRKTDEYLKSCVVQESAWPGNVRSSYYVFGAERRRMILNVYNGNELRRRKRRIKLMRPARKYPADQNNHTIS